MMGAGPFLISILRAFQLFCSAFRVEALQASANLTTHLYNPHVHPGPQSDLVCLLSILPLRVCVLSQRTRSNQLSKHGLGKARCRLMPHWARPNVDGDGRRDPCRWVMRGDRAKMHGHQKISRKSRHVQSVEHSNNVFYSPWLLYTRLCPAPIAMRRRPGRSATSSACSFWYILLLRLSFLYTDSMQSSRGVTFRHRHLLQDLYSLMSVHVSALLTTVLIVK
jgi:hypothetical protein